jgi:hypothetical protein
MKDFDQYKLDFVRALPEPVLDLLADVTRCKSTGEERYVRLANTGPVVSMALLHGVFTSDDLRHLAASVGVNSSGGSDHQIAEEIYAHMIEMRIRSDLGDSYPAFVDFMRSAENDAEPVCLLKSSPATSQDSSIVGYFNPDADFEKEWLLVDMSVHPNAALRDRGVLFLRLDDYEVGSVQWLDSLTDRSSDGWFPMYAEPHAEFPSPEIEDQCESDFQIDFPDERFVQYYESLASWSNLMTRPGVLCRSIPEQPPRVFAQLGGRPYPWVEEPKAEHIGSSVILRTHANSEPWVEVLMHQDGRFFAIPHIT